MYSNIKQIKTVGDMVQYYLRTPQFLSLKPRSQKDYEYNLNKALETSVTDVKKLKDLRISNLSVSHCKIVYQEWLKKGTRTANIMSTTLSVVLRMAEELELLIKNPMSKVKKIKEKARRVMWSQEQVKIFLDTAYSEYKWRSIGLIVHMAYEFAQRIGDMRLLKWENIDFENSRVNLVQSKRRAEVTIPINASLLSMLSNQHKDFGFQEYVAPRPYPRSGAYRVYSNTEVSGVVNAIKKVAKLPPELTAMDMRRTAITEMIEAGVDITQIMAVSGHNSPNSMSPYIKHTFMSAHNALSKREAYKDEVS